MILATIGIYIALIVASPVASASLPDLIL